MATKDRTDDTLRFWRLRSAVREYLNLSMGTQWQAKFIRTRLGRAVFRWAVSAE